MVRRRPLAALLAVTVLLSAAPALAKDASTRKAERVFTALVYERYGDPGPVVSCRKRSSTRWTCSFTAYTGGGQLCQGPGAVRRSGTRYRATVDRPNVVCREE